MSFGNPLKDLGIVQEALILGLMIIIVFTLFSELEWTYKLGIAALAFLVMFLTTLASQILRQIKEEAKRSS